MQATRYILTLRNSRNSETLHFLASASSSYHLRMQAATWLKSINRDPREYRLLGEVSKN